MSLAPRAVALIALFACAATLAPPAAASTPFAACRTGFECATVTVPIDRTNVVPGTLDLHVERAVSGSVPTGTLLFLAGGPGQAALSVFSDIVPMVTRTGSTYQLVSFDQRGTGSSGALVCPSVVEAGRATIATAVGSCATQLGAQRSSYTSRDSADDIEAVRLALGVERIALWGTSYGTKVAIAYAQRYPAHVDRLILDSVVSPDGPDPFWRPSLRTIPRVLAAICDHARCRGATRSPRTDVAAVARQLHAIGGVHGSFIDATGARRPVSITVSDLIDLVISGDTNPAIRAMLPSALRAQRLGDPAPLVRLLATLYGANIGNAGGTGQSFADRRLLAPLSSDAPRGPLLVQPSRNAPTSFASGEVNEALYYATICEESALPWERTLAAESRPGSVRAALESAPSSDWGVFGPWAARLSTTDACQLWPESPFAPTIGDGPLPDVPVLVVEGEEDTRTPLPQGRSASRLFPQATVLTVPNTGHSAITSDTSYCAFDRFGSFLRSEPVKPCADSTPLVSPDPRPREEITSIPAAQRVRGLRGRTLTAMTRAISDAQGISIVAAYTYGFDVATFGGLRGGTVTLARHRLTFHRYSYADSATLSGSLRFKDGAMSGTLRLAGTRSARGTVRVSGRGSLRITGTLDGRPVHVRLAFDPRDRCLRSVCS